MTLLVPERIVGSQEPTHRVDVPYKWTYGDLAVRLVESTGLELDPWQKAFLAAGLGVVDGLDAQGNPAQRWAATRVGVELSRQNGKSAVFEARVLIGLFLLKERVIVYSAHEGETAINAFTRIEALIKANPELHAEVKNEGRSSGFRRTNGQNSITLWDGRQVKFRTRTKGGGRGLFGDCVILDESQDLQDEHVAALLPLMSARPNAQAWYGGSPGTRRSVVQARLIRAAERKVPRLVYWRWANDEDIDPTDMNALARVNPALGRRMTPEFLEDELEDMGVAKFAQEHGGVGDYPREEGEDWVLPRTKWDRAGDPTSTPAGPVVFVPQVKWDRSRTSIAVAGRRADGKIHLEVIRNDAGADWAASELARLVQDHDSLGVVLDPTGANATLVTALTDLGVDIAHLMTPADMSEAWGALYDAIAGPKDATAHEPTYLHRTSSVMTSAMASAEVRTSPTTGATTWKATTAIDTTPVHALTWAAYGVTLLEKPAAPPPAPVPVSDAAPAASPGEFDPMTSGF